jgi:hypothetical protein
MVYQDKEFNFDLHITLKKSNKIKQQEGHYPQIFLCLNDFKTLVFPLIFDTKIYHVHAYNQIRVTAVKWCV